MQQIDDFKDFVKKHPGLKEEVSSGRRSWQNVYEEWTLYQKPEDWSRFSKDGVAGAFESKQTNKTEEMPDFMKSVYGYVKKINPETLTKTIGNIQKIVGLFSTFTQGSKPAGKATGDPLFDKKFDDWY